MANQANTSMADSPEQKIKDCHSTMVISLSKHFDPALKNWEDLLMLLSNDLDPVDLYGKDTNFMKICDRLMANGTISYGSYDKLYEVIHLIDVGPAKIIQQTSDEIKDIMSKGLPEATRPKTGVGDQTKGQPQAKGPRTDEGVGQQQSTEYSPKIAAMIERTKAMIEEDKKRTFIATKGFQDAKEKLHKNQVVVIKGNTGDGKTTTAIRLILGLIEEQQGRQPLQLHNIKDLDSLPPKSKLITFIDDIFGEIVAHEKDVGEWNKRINSVLPMLRGDKDTEANFLLITIRNVVFNSLRSHSLRNVFVDSNIIDLSSNDYKLKGEKLELLELYKPKKDEFSWNEDEKKEIVRYATDIGFPQCCRLFRDIPDLQKERVNFFKKPFDFLKRLLEKEENDLPVEILQMDQQSIQLYRKCLEEKEEEDYRLRVIVIGQTGVGKTTLTRNLLRLPQIPHTESTDGVDIHNSLVNLDDKDWITDADMQHAGKCLDARLIQLLQSIGSENTGADPNTEGDKSAQTASNSDEFDNDDQQNAGLARPIQSLDSTASKNTGADHDDLQNLEPSTPANSNEPVMKTLRNLIKVPLADRDYTKLGELCVWDFAGHFVFYTTHHTFLTHRAVYLLVTRLDQNINDTVNNDQCFIDATGCKEMKIKDFVSYWMNSVHLYSGAAEHLPPVILVGTHLDKVEGDIEKKTKTYFEDLRRYLLDMESPTSRHLIDTDYTVSNPPNELEIGNLRQKIVDLASKQAYWGEKIPAKWITLEKALMEKKIEGVNIMSYDNVVDIDKSTGVPIDDQEKLDLFLRFQHAKGNMIYFSEGCLRDHIVINPQWLIDAFKCIITARQFCTKNPALVKHWKALDKTGKLYLGMVDEIFRREDKFCRHKEHILGLMERLHIISHHVVDKDDDKSNTSEEFYFVPSLLKDKVTECEIENYVKGTNGTPYLCYVFENNFLPTAVFHRLIAACLSEYTVAKQGSKFLIFCGCGIFDLNGGLTRLVVAFYDNIIQIGLFRFSKERCAPETSTCVSVRQFVTKTLERVLDRYDMKLPFTLNLKCEKSPLLSHEGLLSEDAVIKGGEEMVCHGHDKESHIINRDILLHLWFPAQVAATDTNQGDGTPEPSQLSQLIRPSPDSQEENIRKHHADMVRELSEMFSLKSKPGHVICSRDGLSNLVTDNVKDMFDLCRALMKEGKIMYGEYSKLREILVECGVEAGETIDKYTKMIRGESEDGPELETEVEFNQEPQDELPRESKFVSKLEPEHLPIPELMVDPKAETSDKPEIVLTENEDTYSLLAQKYNLTDDCVVPVKDASNQEELIIIYDPSCNTERKLKEFGHNVMIRNQKYVSNEGAFVSSICKNKQYPIRPEDKHILKQVLNHHAKRLFASHSNLNIITTSPVKSKKKGDDISERPCIVLVCSSKGYIPKGESKFPEELIFENTSIVVDVREGYFQFCPTTYPTFNSSLFHQNIKMGCSFGIEGTHNAGTVGPFVDIEGHQLFLTCAHIVNGVDPKGYDLKNIQNMFAEQPDAMTYPHSQTPGYNTRRCGEVRRALFSPNNDISIDAAVVEITEQSRIPSRGEFAIDSERNLKAAGFEDMPRFESGDIHVYSDKFNTDLRIIKFGATTHATRGVISSYGTFARALTTDLGLQDQPDVCVMKNQMEVYSLQGHSNFFLPGDSGSGVFMVNNLPTGEQNLTCIGLAIGSTSYGSAVVTPIAAVLDALELPKKLKQFP